MLKAKFVQGRCLHFPPAVVPLPLVKSMNEGAMCVSELFVIELFSGIYWKSPGAAGPMVMLIVVEDEPAVLLAQTV